MPVLFNQAKYGTWVVGGADLKQAGQLSKTHSSWSKQYNVEWQTFFKGIEDENRRRKSLKLSEISPSEFKLKAEQQARDLAKDPRFDAYGKAGTPDAFGFPVNF